MRQSAKISESPYFLQYAAATDGGRQYAAVCPPLFTDNAGAFAASDPALSARYLLSYEGLMTLARGYSALTLLLCPFLFFLLLLFLFPALGLGQLDTAVFCLAFAQRVIYFLPLKLFFKVAVEILFV